jgi:hypothetical protein
VAEKATEGFFSSLLVLENIKRFKALGRGTEGAVNTRWLALVLSLACLEVPVYSQSRHLALQPSAVNPSKDVPHEVSASELKEAIQSSLVVRSAGVNLPEGAPWMMAPPGLQQTSQQQVRPNWIRRHPKLFGAVVGFGVACPIGAAQVGGSEDNFFNTLDEWACPVLGGIGAAAGAAIGALFSR